MKKIIWLVILVLFINGGFATKVFPRQGTSPPDIDFSEELWDFGTIKQGDVVSHVFEVRNTGGAVLVINRVKTSCGCTAALLSSPEIAPGSSSEIKVSFKSSGYKGGISHHIYVESNDPDESLEELTIRAIVEVPPKPTINLRKDSWDFGLITQGEKPVHILSVENTGEQELVISQLRPSLDSAAELLSTSNIPPGKIGKIRISFDSTGRKGLAREYLYIHSNDPFSKIILFPITGYVIEPKSELSILPTFLNLKTIKQGEKGSGIIKLKNWGEKKIEIVNIDSSSNWIIVTPSSGEVEPGGEVKIDVSLEEETGRMEEYLYITIAIPLEIVIKER